MSARAEKRRQEKAAAKSEAVYNLTHSQLQNYLYAHTDKQMQITIPRLIYEFRAVTALALRREFGFGNSRMERFLRCLDKCLHEGNEKKFTIADVEQMMLEEIGVDLGE